MNHANHLALATSAGDSDLGAMIDGATLGAENDDRCRPGKRRDTDSYLSVLEKELLMLRKRCRALELALATMAGAIGTMRRANRALSDENVLLRQQLAELRERAPADRWPHGPRLRASGGN